MRRAQVGRESKLAAAGMGGSPVLEALEPRQMLSGQVMVDVFLLADDTSSFSESPNFDQMVRTGFLQIIENLETAHPEISFGFGVGRFEDYNRETERDNLEDRPFILNQPIITRADYPPEDYPLDFDTAINAALDDDRNGPGNGGSTPESYIEALYQVATGAGFNGDPYDDDSTMDSGRAGLVLTQTDPNYGTLPDEQPPYDVPAFSTFQQDLYDSYGPVLWPSAVGMDGATLNDVRLGGVGFRPGAIHVVVLAADSCLTYRPEDPAVNQISGANGDVPLSEFIASMDDIHTTAASGLTPSNGAQIQQTITALVSQGILVIGIGTEDDADFAPRCSLEAIAKATGTINHSTSSYESGITDDRIDTEDPFYYLLNANPMLNDGFEARVAEGIAAAAFALTIVSDSPLPAAPVGSTYSTTLAGAFGEQPYTWSIFSGSLPAGLSLDTSSGVISGTPWLSGTYNFTVQVVDSGTPNQTDKREYSLRVGPAAPAAPDLQADNDTGVSNSDNVTSNNTPTFIVSVPATYCFNIYRNGTRIADHQTGTSYTASTQPDGVYLYTVTYYDAQNVESLPSQPLVVTIDTVRPKVRSEANGPMVNTTMLQRSVILDLQVKFSENVYLGSGALTLYKADNSTTPASWSNSAYAEPAVAALTPSMAGTMATWDLSGIAFGNASWYRTVLNYSLVTDLAGNAMAFDYDDYAFARLAGDANGDAMVDVADLGVLGYAYGTSSGDPNYNVNADFNLDLFVDVGDTGILGFNYGTDISTLRPEV